VIKSLVKNTIIGSSFYFTTFICQLTRSITEMQGVVATEVTNESC